jgi:tRNA G18 (ribose-2'-O)-methylase SpoU
MHKLSHAEVVNRQKDRVQQPRLPFVVVLNNIRSLYNVGSIFRTADGVGVDKIWLCGITGCPPNNQISKTALGAQEHISWEYREETGAVLKELKEARYQIVLLEQTDGSSPYQDFVPNPPVCLVIGNEVEGIGVNIFPLCDRAIEIEMAGVKNSLNVAVAFGIIAYHFRGCLQRGMKAVC